MFKRAKKVHEFLHWWRLSQNYCQKVMSTIHRWKKVPRSGAYLNINPVYLFSDRDRAKGNSKIPLLSLRIYGCKWYWLFGLQTFEVTFFPAHHTNAFYIWIKIIDLDMCHKFHIDISIMMNLLAIISDLYLCSISRALNNISSMVLHVCWLFMCSDFDFQPFNVSKQY